MKNIRLIIFILVALAQLALPASMIWKRQQTYREGRLWKFRMAPVDPVDALRGRYLTLRYDAETFPYEKLMPDGRTAYVTFKEDAEGFAVVDQVSATPVSGDNSVRVDSYGVYEKKARVNFPFDEFWITEANATAAEQAYFAHSNRQNRDAYVTVRIRHGDAAIEDLYLGGQPLREYLRGR